MLQSMTRGFIFLLGSPALFATSSFAGDIVSEWDKVTRKLKVIVPVDGLSASTLYIEQATLINLVIGPGTRKNTTLTKLDLISIE